MCQDLIEGYQSHDQIISQQSSKSTSAQLERVQVTILVWVSARESCVTCVLKATQWRQMLAQSVIRIQICRTHGKPLLLSSTYRTYVIILYLLGWTAILPLPQKLKNTTTKLKGKVEEWLGAAENASSIFQDSSIKIGLRGLKIFIAYFQIIVGFMPLKVDWPDAILNSLSALKKLSLSFEFFRFPGLSCPFLLKYESEMLLNTCVPLFVLACLVLQVLVAWCMYVRGSTTHITTTRVWCWRRQQWRPQVWCWRRQQWRRGITCSCSFFLSSQTPCSGLYKASCAKTLVVGHISVCCTKHDLYCLCVSCYLCMRMRVCMCMCVCLLCVKVVQRLKII